MPLDLEGLLDYNVSKRDLVGCSWRLYRNVPLTVVYTSKCHFYYPVTIKLRQGTIPVAQDPYLYKKGNVLRF